MANDKFERLPEAEENAVAAKKKAKGGGIKALGKRIGRWFREMRSELKKVVWPTRKQTLNNCLVSIAIMVAAGVVLWAFDQLAVLCVQALISIGA